jgi:hypothetical protein
VVGRSREVTGGVGYRGGSTVVGDIFSMASPRLSSQPQRRSDMFGWPLHFCGGFGREHLEGAVSPKNVGMGRRQ